MAQKKYFAATGGKTQLRLSENGFHKKIFYLAVSFADQFYIDIQHFSRIFE